jgi:urease accessory protein
MPENLGCVSYAAGFMLATALMHLLGIGTGFYLYYRNAARGFEFIKVAGGAGAFTGAAFLFGLI